MARNSSLVISSALLLALTPAFVDAQPPSPPCSGAEYHQFDFWIGDWEVTGADGKLAGHNRIEAILGGCVLFENWDGAGGGAGKSFNMYSATDGQWRQTWVDAQGGRLDLAGGLDEQGRMVLTGTRPAKGGGTARHEISWEQRPDGSVRQHWRASKDDGKTWSDLFDGIYRKR